MDGLHGSYAGDGRKSGQGSAVEPPSAPVRKEDREAGFPRVRLVPPSISSAVLRGLERVSDFLVARHMTANAITATCAALGLVAGLLLADGAFALAALVMIVASLGDALDGMVARRSRTASAQGALLDASCDRYQEFFVLAGLAVTLRDSAFALCIVLLAMVGSFMVSYGSAKAEALGAPVPASAMRRPERAVVLCVGTAATAVFAPIADHAGLTRGIGVLPVVIAVFAIAVFANASAVMRLRAIGDSVAEKNVAASQNRSKRTPLLGLRCPPGARR
jgi:CDP-diacylglycerol--glycerol-3-phosphate 3-phosphatidyltransferase